MRAAFLVSVVTLAACAGASHGPQAAAMAGMPEVHGGGPSDASAYDAEVQAGYARARAATKRFHVLDSAVAAGYTKDVADCFTDSLHAPSQGAMGYHHINRSYVDKSVDIEKPEILMYEKRADGTYELTGAEYLIPYRFWPKDSVPPRFLGREMMREETRNYWYSHMWLWNRNSAGLFADWNPAVTCRGKSRAFGTFDVTMAPLAPYDTAVSGRMSIDKKFHGDLEGTSRGEMLAVLDGTRRSGAYVAIERVTGAIKGRAGTFSLHHTGVLDNGAQRLRVEVVPGSGTGDLAGITGALWIMIEGSVHRYELEYTLPAKR